MASKSRGRIGEGLFEPLPPDHEFVEAICDNDPKRAARLLRELDTLGRHALDALADMLERGAQDGSRQGYQHPVVLKIAPAQSPGRPRRGEVRKAGFRADRQRKTPLKSPGWERMIARRVQELIERGLTRVQAIEEARRYFPFAKEDEKKPTPYSFSAVEKAYDRFRNKLRKLK